MKAFFRVLMLCIILSGSLFLFYSLFSEKKKITVGIIDCYTGTCKNYTNDVRNSFQMAMDAVNRNGGILGRKIEIIIRNSEFNVDVGLKAAKELIFDKKVSILLGTTNSALSLKISELCKKEKVPFFVTFAKSKKITGEKGHRYVFSMTENTALIGNASAIALSRIPFKRYWIAGDDYEYGHTLSDDVWESLKVRKPDVAIVGISWWKVGETNFSPYIERILSARPDALIVATGGTGCIPFLKAANRTGLNEKVSIFMHTATELSTLIPLGLKAPERVYGTSNYHYFYPDSPENREFVEQFQATYQRLPKVGALYGYIAATYIIEGFKKANSINIEKFIDSIEGMSIESPVGKLTLRGFDHQVTIPMYFGITQKLDGYPYLMINGITKISGEEVMASIEDIKKLRGMK